MSSQWKMVRPAEWQRHEAAQAWCKEGTSDKVMDTDLCEAFAEIIDGIINPLPGIPASSLPVYKGDPTNE